MTQFAVAGVNVVQPFQASGRWPGSAPDPPNEETGCTRRQGALGGRVHYVAGCTRWQGALGGRVSGAVDVAQPFQACGRWRGSAADAGPGEWCSLLVMTAILRRKRFTVVGSLARQPRASPCRAVTGTQVVPSPQPSNHSMPLPRKTDGPLRGAAGRRGARCRFLADQQQAGLSSATGQRGPLCVHLQEAADVARLDSVEHADLLQRLEHLVARKLVVLHAAQRSARGFRVGLGEHTEWTGRSRMSL
eukprot:359028-Chlamydomonas_euryale.AAC.1